MNPALKRLKDLYLDKYYKSRPNIPDSCRFAPKFTDKTANGLTKSIITWLQLSGWQAERIGNTGRIIDQRETVTDVIGRTRKIGSFKWVKGSGTNGTADISATIYGKSVKIEVKIGRDYQSEAQKQYQRSIEAAGGVYIIARTLDGFLAWYDGFLTKGGK